MEAAGVVAGVEGMAEGATDGTTLPTGAATELAELVPAPTAAQIWLLMVKTSVMKN